MERESFLYIRGMKKVMHLTWLVLLLVSTGMKAGNYMKSGTWRGVLTLNDSTGLPFNFEVKNELEIYSVIFMNAKERIVANEIVMKGDSVFIQMPVFDSEFRCRNLGDSLSGVWINHARKTNNII